MGRLYTFECSKCGFIGHVSGGEDRGAVCFTRTMICRDCRELYEIVTHVRLEQTVPPSAPEVKRRHWQRALSQVILPGHAHASRQALRQPGRMMEKLLPGADPTLWVELRMSCPKSSGHAIEPWKDPGPCPRCGTFLDKTLMPFLVWE